MDAPSRLLVAVFASPVADVLLRWGTELGFRTVLVEPGAADVEAVSYTHLTLPTICSV